MAFEGMSDKEIRKLQARCRRAARTANTRELKRLEAVLQEQTGLSTLQLINRLARTV